LADRRRLEQKSDQRFLADISALDHHIDEEGNGLDGRGQSAQARQLVVLQLRHYFHAHDLG
jgi:hypothetical protein